MYICGSITKKMNHIYLDNAATTPMLPEVIETMTHTMETVFGNPSSTHQMGRMAKSVVENARKNIAAHFKASASEILFTSGGSEADNFILKNAVENLGVTTIISSKIEHKAVLETLALLEKTHQIKVLWVHINEKGRVDEQHLEELLTKNDDKKLVSLMYVNNEIGTLLPLKRIGTLCKEHNALFHSDTVQGIGHFRIDVNEIPIDFFAASAHKFHGPKGVGFLFARKGLKVKSQLSGGHQERGMRAGTENIAGISGMEKALEIAYKNLKEDADYIQGLKTYCIQKIEEELGNMVFNGSSKETAHSSYIILNIRLAKDYKMLLFKLDLQGIAVSGGSACQSGSEIGSYVLNEILPKEEALKTSIRISFSKLNTKEEIDKMIQTIKKLIEQ